MRRAARHPHRARPPARRRRRRPTSMRIRLTLAVIAGLVVPVAAQSGPATAASATAAATTTATPLTPATVATQTPATAGEPSGYTYHPEGRRDPFVSLLRHAAE